MAAAVPEIWSKKTFLIITGASRGIGRKLAEKWAEILCSGSTLLLISRDGTSLESLRKTISTNHPGIHAHVGVADLSACHESDLDAIVKETLTASGFPPEDFAHAVCVHNAGALGDASKRCNDLLQLESCMDYFRLNVASVMVLNAIFMRTFRHVRKTVVNISSLCGVEAFPSLALYCTGKAAREMFFKVLAKEEPETRVLNYAPGPVETNMLNQLREQSWDAEMKASISGGALSTETTCNRLIQLLFQDRYPSGSHVDYFDPPFE